MKRPGVLGGRTGIRRRLAMIATGALALSFLVPLSSASAAGVRLDLRVLVVDDGSVMVGAISHQLDLEGVPHTDVRLSDPSRPAITSGYLSNGDEGFYQAVVLPQSSGQSWLGSESLSTAELSALTAYESAFAVRQVDADENPGVQVGLQPYAGQTSTTWAGGLEGLTGTVTPAARAAGWGYLSGPVPFRVGTYALLSTPLTATSTPAMAAGASYTSFVTVPIPGSASAGSLVGSYSSGGREQLVVTGAFSASLQQFRMLAHGIVTWATKGVHFGFNRNYYTQHFDDAFSYDARWDATNHCTPGEDCAAGVTTTTPDIRMTAADVDHLVTWQAANGYSPTLAFNAYYSKFDSENNLWNGTDPLTNAFVANKSSIRWLNHGYEHIFQGCQQNFTIVPWKCTTTDGLPVAADGSNIVWVPQTAVASEISDNLAQGTALGLPFDHTEYLSGEHSGLYLTPQQPVDNPGFAAALSPAGISVIGADASREPAQRVVGGAVTVPRHPVAVYYNVSTMAEEVSEYNWIYLSAANGGSGYCDANPATATCLPAALDPATGFTSYIVPTDVANDLGFILSNDPRPFYAHVSNLTAPDYLGLTLMSSVLSTYRSSFAANAPLVNQTLTEASAALQQQAAWSTTGMPVGSAVSGYLQDGVVTIVNPTAVAAPLTAPVGTLVNGAAFGSAYGGELSGWIAGNAVLTMPFPTFSGATSATFKTGTLATVTITAANAVSIAAAGSLPAGVTFVDNGNGTATLAGTPVAGSAGAYPLNLTATNAQGSATSVFTLTVVAPLVFTNAATASFTAGAAGSFTISVTGSPVPVLTLSGTLPAGVTFVDNGNGTATLAGTPVAGSAGTYPLTLTATNPEGSATSVLTLTVVAPPVFTSAATASFSLGAAGSFTISVTGSPVPVLTLSGALPRGLVFRNNGNGTATVSGTPTSAVGSYPVTATATNAVGTVSQALTVVVARGPAITSAGSTTATVGRAGTFTVRASGNPAPTLTVTGTLPSGVTFKDNLNGTGTLSGQPAAGTGGVYPLTVRATNAGGSASSSLTLTVREAPVFTSPATATVTRGVTFTISVTTRGTPTAVLTTTNGLPAGVSFRNNGNGTGTLSGRIATAGTRTIGLAASNVVARVTQSMRLVVS